MPRRKADISYKIRRYLSDNPVVDFLKDNPAVKTAFYITVLLVVLSWLGLFRLGPIIHSENDTISVTGSYSTQEYNRVATYIATISNTGTNRDDLINDINERSVELIESAKDFGVDQLDIKTTNNYIYQVQDPETLRRYRQGQTVWRAGTSVEIKIRDVNKVRDFNILLNTFTNTEIYGPNYSLDEQDVDEALMLSEAVKDAVDKAKFIAEDQNKILGRMVSIEEVSGMSYMPYGGEVLGLGSGGGDSIESSPGATKVTKTVRVKFRLLH